MDPFLITVFSSSISSGVLQIWALNPIDDVLYMLHTALAISDDLFSIRTFLYAAAAAIQMQTVEL